MKLLIQTQIQENYGAHDWDGSGECPQRWKFKGGNTYVVDGVTEAQKVRIECEGIPTLEKLLNEDNDSYREYVIDARVIADDASEGEEWETPYRLSYELNRWVARRTVENGEFGYMRREIKSKTQTYVLGTAGERLQYAASYLLRNDKTVVGDTELLAALEEMELI